MTYTVKLQATRTVYIEVDARNEAVAQEKALEAYQEDRLIYLQAGQDIVDVLSITEEGP